MKCYEFFCATGAVSKNDGPYIPDDRRTYVIPEEAQVILEPIMEYYDQDPMWYFDKLNYGRPPAPWALACLNQEYSIAGHIISSRPSKSISLAPYTQYPSPIPQNYVPKVGTIVIFDKEALEEVSSKSLIFQKLWEVLRDCSIDQRWLLILDPLPNEWLDKVVPKDNELWISNMS